MKGSVKIAIVGAGAVGSSAAFALMSDGIADEIALIDVNKEKAEGEALDLEHGSQFVPDLKITAGDDFSLCKDAKIVIITAGKPQKPGETRLDLAKKNAGIFKEMIPKIVEANKNCIFVIVSNPLDVMTYLTLKYSGFPKERVIGSGTTLDTARLRYYLGTHFGINPERVHAYILGEHGDSEFPVWSLANILGMPLSKIEGYDKQVLDKCFKKTKNAAYEIISKKGATYYAISLALVKIVRAIIRNEREIFPLSTYIENYYDETDLCLSIPCVIGRKGIIRTIQLELDDKEQISLHKSARTIKEAIEAITQKS